MEVFGDDIGRQVAAHTDEAADDVSRIADGTALFNRTGAAVLIACIAVRMGVIAVHGDEVVIAPGNRIAECFAHVHCGNGPLVTDFAQRVFVEMEDVVFQFFEETVDVGSVCIGAENIIFSEDGKQIERGGRAVCSFPGVCERLRRAVFLFQKRFPLRKQRSVGVAETGRERKFLFVVTDDHCDGRIVDHPFACVRVHICEEFAYAVFPISAYAFAVVDRKFEVAGSFGASAPAPAFSFGVSKPACHGVDIDIDAVFTALGKEITEVVKDFGIEIQILFRFHQQKFIQKMNADHIVARHAELTDIFTGFFFGVELRARGPVSAERGGGFR